MIIKRTQVPCESALNPALHERKTRSGFAGVVYLALALVFAISQQTIGRAQTQTPAERAPQNRYLLLVETSRSMQRRTNAVFETVHELLGSGMQAQLRHGDTIGLWTFNEAVQNR